MKPQQSIAFFIVIFFLSLNTHAQFSGGDGTEANPWQITTVQQLDSMRGNVNGYYILMNNLDFSGTEYDSINNSFGWEPIRETANYPNFASSQLDGNGFSINNLYINRPTEDYVGLFGNIVNVTIKNLTLNNINITGGGGAGGLTGSSRSSTLLNCSVYGKISGENIVGGLAGIVRQSQLRDCKTDIEISGIDQVGGFVGLNTESSSIVRCFSKGTVSGNDRVGGFIGHNYHTSPTDSCFTNTLVVGNHNVGGFIGDNYESTIRNCFSICKISGQSNTGGFLGYQYGATTEKSYTSSLVLGDVVSGGFAGYSHNSGISNCYSNGATLGKDGVGGFAGKNKDGYINACYSTNIVERISRFGSELCGLFVGYNSTDGTISQSYYNVRDNDDNQAFGVDDNNQSATALSTSQMKQSSSFSGFNFSETWDISEEVSYPCLSLIHDYPIIFFEHNFIKTNELYTDTLTIIQMDDDMAVVNFFLEESPDLMQLNTDSIINWNAGDINLYDITISVEDSYFPVVSHAFRLEVVPFHGSGTTQDPFQIESIEHLDFVRNLLHYDFSLMTDLDFSGSPFDSINSSDGWVPIGDSLYPFTGSFNGNDHVINNLFINRNSGYNGLWGYISNAELSNIKIRNCNLLGGYYYTGGLTGIANNSSNIKMCSVSGVVKGANNVGGLAGSVFNSDAIRNYTLCQVYGDTAVGGYIGYVSGISNVLESFSNGITYGNNNIGGFIGKTIYPLSNVSITNSYATGTVYGIGHVGGLIGDIANTTVEMCYSAVCVNGEHHIGSFISGCNTSDNCSFSDNYYNSTIGELDNMSPGINSSNVTGLTSDEMKQETSFNDLSWNFDTIWDIQNGVTFPSLQALPQFSFVISKNLHVTNNEILIDTISVELQGNSLISINLVNPPDGLTLSQDTIITWTPEQFGTYDIFIELEANNEIIIQKAYTIYVSPFEGSGSVDDPYQITSIEELDFIRNLPDKSYILMNDLDFNGSAYSSDSSELGWDPICNYFLEFTGSFDGNGYSINNLFINRNSENYIGLFGYISNGTINNLSLVNANVTGYFRTGGIAGKLVNNSTINNCNVSGNITGEEYTGGLVGEATDSSSITNSNTSISIIGVERSGGICGDISNCNINNCYSIGDVRSNKYVGGLIGRTSNSSIDHCFTITDIIAGYYAGGVIGYAQGGSEILSCYSSSKVNGYYQNAGGLIGGAVQAVIKNCYSSGIVLSNWNPGGLIGSCSYCDTVLNCYSISTNFDGYEYHDIIGVSSNSQLQNLYTNIEISPSTFNIDSINITTLTTGQMQQEASFPGFDFENVWEIYEGTSLPRLRQMYDCPVLLSKAYKMTLNEPYNDSLVYIPMDSEVSEIEVSLGNIPMYINIQPDNHFSWTPDSLGYYDFSANVIDPPYSFSQKFLNSEVVYFVNGRGFPNQPYEIYTLNELDYVRHYLNSSYILMSDLDFEGSSFNLSEEGWQPIGGSDNPFTGSFNGNNHYINNLSINQPTNDLVGLFGKSENAEISKLNISGFDIIGRNYLGGLVGVTYDTQIDSCNVNGELNGSRYAGGLVGRINFSNITNCSAECIISGDRDVAGLVGYCNNSQVDSCFAQGKVSADNAVGGIAGSLIYSASINKCISNCIVAGSNKTGGLVGSISYSDITRSYSTGGIMGDIYVGGIVGYAMESSVNQVYTTSRVVGDSYSGRLIGYDDSNLSILDTSYYNVDIEGVEATVGLGNVGDFVSGLSSVEMKDSASFIGFDFAETWEISNGITFPRLKNQPNFPIVLHKSIHTQLGEIVQDTLQTIMMNNSEIVLSSYIDQGPEGLTMQEGNVISWTTDSLGVFDVDVRLEVGEHVIYHHALTIHVTPFIGEGTVESPYQITSIEELSAIGDYPGMYFELTNDIDFDGLNGTKNYAWEPIGYDTGGFSGYFDGKGHIIKNLKIQTYDSDLGLFCSLENAIICNLGLINCTFSGTDNIGSFAGIVGENTKITNCYSAGVSIIGDNNIGGICGIIQDSASINNCYTTGIVQGYMKIGGLIGQTINDATVSNCYSVMHVEGNESVGGLIGGTNSSYYYETLLEMQSCYFAGTVSGNYKVGTLIGYNDDINLLTYSYFNEDHTEDIPIIGYSQYGNSPESCYGLSTVQMKSQENYIGWDFDSIWIIREDSTYPGIFSLNNPPFAFADTVIVSADEQANLFINDFDVENIQQNLVGKILDSTYTMASGYLLRPSWAVSGSLDTIAYCIGEICDNDTIWGNEALAYITITGNAPPVIDPHQVFSVDENIETELILGNIIASDADGEVNLTNWIISSGNNDSIFSINENGELLVVDHTHIDYENNSFYELQVTVSDGMHTSNPEIIRVEIVDINENLPIIIPSQEFAVNDNAENGISIGFVLAEFSDSTNNIIEWNIVEGNTDNVFSINNTSGEITVNNNAFLDYLVIDQYVLSLNISSGSFNTDPEDITIYVNDCSSINIQETKFQVYPNPVTNKIYFYQVNSGIKLIEIFDNNGKTLLVQDSNFKNYIDVSSLPVGAFILKISFEDGSFSVSQMVKK